MRMKEDEMSGTWQGDIIKKGYRWGLRKLRMRYILFL